MSLSLAVADRLWGRLPTVLITGTNGKTAVTALTGALLSAAGRRPFVGGNISMHSARRAHPARATGRRRLPGPQVLELPARRP